MPKDSGMTGGKKKADAESARTIDAHVARLIGLQGIMAPDGSVMVTAANDAPVLFSPTTHEQTATQVVRDVVRQVGGVFNMGIMKNQRTGALEYAATWRSHDTDGDFITCPGHTVKQAVCLTVMEMGRRGVLPPPKKLNGKGPKLVTE